MIRRLAEKDFPDITVFYRTLAYLWLRYEQGCYLITFERVPYGGNYAAKPDVLGMNKRRRLLEVEIKVSLADMKRDLEKVHRTNVPADVLRQNPTAPSRLYYFVPAHLVGDALELLPTYVGVLSPHPHLRDSHSGFPAVALHRRATALHDKPVSMRTVTDMVRDLSGTMASLLTEMTYILREHPEHIRNGRLDFDSDRVHAKERLPVPFAVTPPQAVFDDGSRSGKAIAKTDLDPIWQSKPKAPKAPTTAVRRS